MMDKIRKFIPNGCNFRANSLKLRNFSDFCDTIITTYHEKDRSQKL